MCPFCAIGAPCGYSITIAMTDYISVGSAYQKTNNGNSYYFGGGSVLVPYTQGITKSGEVTPHYAELVSKGAMLPNNNYTLEKGCDRYVVNFSFTALNVHQNPAYTATWVVTRDVTKQITVTDLQGNYKYEIEMARNKCRARLRDKIRDTQFQLMVEIGELRETRRMIIDILNDIRNFNRSFKQRNFNSMLKDVNSLLSSADRRTLQRMRSASKAGNLSEIKGGRARRALRSANDRYLQYTYGIAPLCSSLEDAAKLAVKQINALDTKRTFVRAKATYKGDHGKTEVQYSGAFSSNPFHYLERNTFEYVVRMGGLLKDTDTSKAKQWGLSFSEIVPTVWELTTLSFVADYLTNFGDWLKNLDFAVKSLTSSSMWVSERIRSVIEPTGFVVEPLPGGNYELQVLNHKITGILPAEKVWYQRRDLTLTDSMVTFQFETPTMKQAINMASLAMARFL